MKFFNNKERAFLFRVNGLVSIVVKPNTLSDSINYFNLNKHKIKYLFGNFPILFESENERRRFDKKLIPYVLYKEEIKEQRNVTVEPEIKISMDNKKTVDRFVDTKPSNVKEEELPSFTEIKEKEVLVPEDYMKDVVEDVNSGDLTRILNNISEDVDVKKKYDMDDTVQVDIADDWKKGRRTKKSKTDKKKEDQKSVEEALNELLNIK